MFAGTKVEGELARAASGNKYLRREPSHPFLRVGNIFNISDDEIGGRTE